LCAVPKGDVCKQSTTQSSDDARRPKGQQPPCISSYRSTKSCDGRSPGRRANQERPTFLRPIVQVFSKIVTRPRPPRIWNCPCMIVSPLFPPHALFYGLGIDFPRKRSPFLMIVTRLYPPRDAFPPIPMNVCPGDHTPSAWYSICGAPLDHAPSLCYGFEVHAPILYLIFCCG